MMSLKSASISLNLNDLKQVFLDSALLLALPQQGPVHGLRAI
jgi:hypothetical protein